MRKKKESTRISPLSIKEVSSIAKLASQFEYLKKGVSNNNGTFSHVNIKSNKPFNKNDIKIITKWFQANYNNVLMFEDEGKVGELYVGSLFKLAN